MKRSKKLIVIPALLAVSLGALVVAGCSKNNAEETSSPDAAQSSAPALEKVKLRIVFPGDEPQAQREVADEIARVSRDELNVDLSFTYIPWDQYWNKVNTMISSGESFDIFWNHASNLSQFVGKKGLYGMNELLDKEGQDVKKVVPDSYWQTSTIGGEIYGVSAVEPAADANKILLIRKDLREKYGLPTIETIADLEKYFDAVHKDEPTMMVHLGAGTPRFMYRELGNPILIPTGGQAGDNASVIYVDPTDPNLQVKSFYDSDIFKQLSAYGKKWNEAGWIPNLQEIKDHVGPFKEGLAASVWATVGAAPLFMKEMKDKVPGVQLEEVFLNPTAPKYLNNAAGNLLSIPATSEHADRAMKFINWIYKSQENFDLMSYGIKDKHYVAQGEGMSLPVGVTPDKNPYNAINWAWSNINFNRFDVSYTDEDIQRMRDWDKNAVNSPLLGFQFDPAPVKNEIAQLNAIEAEFFSLMYTGVLDYDKNIGKYMERMKKAGLDKVIAEAQSQIDAVKAAKQ